MDNGAMFKQVAAAALERFDDVMSWLGIGGGKRQGKEYLALNPTRADNSLGSFSINTKTGAWIDGASGDKGGDLVSLTAYIRNLKQADAARELGGLLGVAVPQPGTGNPRTGGGQANTPATPAKATSGPPAKPDKGEAKDGEIIMPVPDDAPPPPAAHPRIGKPARRWEYRDSEGRLLFLVCRFEVEGRKDIRPLTLRRLPSGKWVWRWLGVGAPRPLYGLDALASRPDDPVMICEGEKAADAAAVLFPDHVPITSPNGAKAADKADWRPLAGRRCVIWADADEPGQAYAVEVCKRLHEAGVAEVRRLDVGLFLALPDGVPREALPEGWDAADATADGFTSELVAERLAAQPDPFPLIAVPILAAVSAAPAGHSDHEQPAQPAEAFPPPGPRFELTDKGVYFVATDKDGDPVRTWVCAPLEVLARVRDPHNKGWGKLVEFTDPDRMTHREILGDDLLSGDGAELERKLRSWGLQIAPKRRNSLLEYLITSRPKGRARITTRTGWHEGSAGLVFVLPHSSVGDSGEVWLFDDGGVPAHNFKTRGTLDEWRQEVAALCIGNSRLVFSASLAFASPLLRLAEMESGGFHFISNSSNGKTTAMRLAASVCGGPDYMQRWRATDNGLEAMAMQHCDAPLLLDELAQLDPRIAGETAYMLANGSGKARAQRTGGIRDTAKWQLLFLSAGEIGLAQHMAEAGKQSKAGQEIRIAEIPADAGAGLGVFENLHGEANGGDFARALDKAIRAYHGTAFPVFLEAISSKTGEYGEAVRGARKVFASHYLTDDASGQARRVADRFALVGAAGELATKLGITGWPQGEALKASGACFKAWLSLRGGEGNAEERAMVAQVRGFLERHGEARFSDWSRSVAKDDHAPRVVNRAGWRRRVSGDSGLPEDDDTEYLILPNVFKEEVCKGFNHNAVGKLLAGLGYLKTEPSGGKLCPKYKPPGEAHQRMYHVLPAIFDAE